MLIRGAAKNQWIGVARGFCPMSLGYEKEVVIIVVHGEIWLGVMVRETTVEIYGCWHVRKLEIGNEIFEIRKFKNPRT